MTTLRSLLLALTVAAPLHAIDLEETPSAVAVGKGSFAASVPKAEDFEDKDGVPTDVSRVSKFLNSELYLEDSAKGKPLPTNDWWTNLIFEPRRGNLWAYPLM